MFILRERLAASYRSSRGRRRLGVAYALFRIYAEEDRRRKKPRQPKRIDWVAAVADKRVGMGASDRERWEIPEDFKVFVNGRRWLVSREEDKREEDKKGIERLRAYPADDEHKAPQWGPTYGGFARWYLSEARKRRRRRK